MLYSYNFTSLKEGNSHKLPTTPSSNIFHTLIKTFYLYLKKLCILRTYTVQTGFVPIAVAPD